MYLIYCIKSHAYGNNAIHMHNYVRWCCQQQVANHDEPIIHDQVWLGQLPRGNRLFPHSKVTISYSWNSKVTISYSFKWEVVVIECCPEEQMLVFGGCKGNHRKSESPMTLHQPPFPRHHWHKLPHLSPSPERHEHNLSGISLANTCPCVESRRNY